MNAHKVNPGPCCSGLYLTFFYADFGKEFPSRTFWRGPSRDCPSPSSVMCPFLYRTEHFSRGKKWRKGAEQRGGRGVARKGGKKEKRTRENRSAITREKTFGVSCLPWKEASIAIQSARSVPENRDRARKQRYSHLKWFTKGARLWPPRRALGVSRALRARNPKKVWKKSLPGLQHWGP